MIIAVNVAFLHQSIGNTNFLIECFKRLANKHPQHQFVFISDAAIDKNFISTSNISAINKGPKIRNSLSATFWVNYILPAIVKKNQAAVLISFNTIAMRCAVPQCLIINDLNYLIYQNKQAQNFTKFYKKNLQIFFNKANGIVTSSKNLKQTIINNYKIAEDKITPIYYGVNEIFSPISWQEKEKIKEKFTSGKEYFLYSGKIDSEQNLINLLKAFSFFKKRQKSNMQLVFASTGVITDKKFLTDISTYKLKTDIQLLQNISAEEFAKITASAYTMILPNMFENISDIALSAFQSGIAVILNRKEEYTEILGDACVYTNASDFNDIAEKMMIVFKDESLLNQYISKGFAQSKLYNWDTTTDLFWSTINNTIL